MMLMSRIVMPIKLPRRILSSFVGGIALRSASSSAVSPFSPSNHFTRSAKRERNTPPFPTQTPSAPRRISQAALLSGVS